MAAGIFRLRLPDGTVRLAAGTTDAGPIRLLDPHLTIAGRLRKGVSSLGDALRSQSEADRPVPPGSVLLAPVDNQEIWAAGVTYRRSRDARKDESTAADVYDRVYVADRPELFFKSPGWRVRGPGDAIGIRADSHWDVPEPELGIAVAADGSIAGWVIGNDVSSRSIEGDNPLYLPQAKVYDGSCALGPCLVPVGEENPPFIIHLSVERDEAIEVEGSTSTDELARDLEELVEHLTRALEMPDGAILLTGTGIVPPASFSLKAGDVVRIAIDGLGELVNPVVTVGGPVIPRRTGSKDA